MNKIDIKDLCVGSYVQDLNGCLLGVKEISSVSIVCDSYLKHHQSGQWISVEGNYSLEDLLPIPISRDRLIDLNGEVIPNSSSIFLGKTKLIGYDLTIYESGGEWWLNRAIICIGKPKSIHNLQQLLWAASGVWIGFPKEKVVSP